MSSTVADSTDRELSDVSACLERSSPASEPASGPASGPEDVQDLVPHPARAPGPVAGVFAGRELPEGSRRASVFQYRTVQYAVVQFWDFAFSNFETL